MSDLNLNVSRLKKVWCLRFETFQVVNEMEPASVWMCFALIIVDAILLLAAK